MAVKKAAKKKPVKKAVRKKKKNLHCCICHTTVGVDQDTPTEPHFKCNECERVISYNILDTFVNSSVGCAVLMTVGEALMSPDGDALEVKDGWRTDGLPPLRIRLPDGAEYEISVEHAIDVIVECTGLYTDATMFSEGINGWDTDQLEYMFLVALYFGDFNEFADLFIRVTEWEDVSSKLMQVVTPDEPTQDEKWKQATVNSG